MFLQFTGKRPFPSNPEGTQMATSDDARGMSPTSSSAAVIGRGLVGVDVIVTSSENGLYVEAKRLEVPGRSAMSRDELAQAVAERQS